MPTNKEWEELSQKINCQFNDSFKTSVNLMYKWSFPGDICNVSCGYTNGNDTISFVYDQEIKAREWDENMIPFYGIGNGDYFCINKFESPNSKVYYFYNDINSSTEYTSCFEKWLEDLPLFLA